MNKARKLSSSARVRRKGIACASAVSLALAGAIVVPAVPGGFQVTSANAQTAPQLDFVRVFNQTKDDANDWHAKVQFTGPGTVTSVRFIFQPEDGTTSEPGTKGSLPATDTYQVVKTTRSGPEVLGTVTGTAKESTWKGLAVYELAVDFTSNPNIGSINISRILSTLWP